MKQDKSFLITCCNPAFTLLGLVLAVQSSPVIADNANPNASATQQSAESAQDRAYKEELLKLSNAIVQKVSQIQAKQKELDE